MSGDISIYDNRAGIVIARRGSEEIAVQRMNTLVERMSVWKAGWLYDIIGSVTPSESYFVRCRKHRTTEEFTQDVASLEEAFALILNHQRTVVAV
jgi:hypothetical protein